MSLLAKTQVPVVTSWLLAVTIFSISLSTREFASERLAAQSSGLAGDHFLRLQVFLSAGTLGNTLKETSYYRTPTCPEILALQLDSVTVSRMYSYVMMATLSRELLKDSFEIENGVLGAVFVADVPV